jgi:hypothetical protein
MERCQFEAAIAAQRLALPAAQRLRAGSRELAAEIRLVERAVSNRQPRQAVGDAMELQFRRNAAEDEMRMLARGRDQRVPGGFNRRVASLNGKLRRRKIRADKQIDVRRLDLRDLRETLVCHGMLLSKWRETEPSIACGKGRALWPARL